MVMNFFNCVAYVSLYILNMTAEFQTRFKCVAAGKHFLNVWKKKESSFICT